jgi:hypothetical protein
MIPQAAVPFQKAALTITKVSEILRLPRTMNGHLQSITLATKNGRHLRRTLQKYCACHTERLLTR